MRDRLRNIDWPTVAAVGYLSFILTGLLLIPTLDCGDPADRVKSTEDENMTAQVLLKDPVLEFQEDGVVRIRVPVEINALKDHLPDRMALAVYRDPPLQLELVGGSLWDKCGKYEAIPPALGEGENNPAIMFIMAKHHRRSEVRINANLAFLVRDFNEQTLQLVRDGFLRVVPVTDLSGIEIP